MTSETFLTAEQVAPLIGFGSGYTFLKNRATLENDTGFPQPLPTSRRPLLWRQSAIAEWLDRQGVPDWQQHAAGKVGNVRLLEMARSR